MVEAVYSIKNVRKEIVAMKVKYNVVWGKIQNIITLILVFTSYFWKISSECSNSVWNSPDQNTGVGSFSLFQGIFPTQGSNPGLPHCKWILYQLSHKWSPRILDWVAYPFSSRSPQPRNWTVVSCITGRFFTNWAIREVPQRLIRKL